MIVRSPFLFFDEDGERYVKTLKVRLLLILPILVLISILSLFGGESSITIDSSAQSTQDRSNVARAPKPAISTTPSAISDSDRALQNAFDRRQSKLQIQGKATVYRILDDDLKGSRHQRFLLRTGTGLSLLVAHNIDIAPRIPSIKVGDTVEFYGVYEYNDKGGVLHWTHHDPGGRHVDGWLHHNGKNYR
jgi:hypothetical protein